MNKRLVLVSVALVAGLLEGCDRMQEPAGQPKAAVPDVMSSPAQVPAAPQISPTAVVKSKDLKGRIQGHTDPNEPAQQRGFDAK